ncbi:MAG: hypothetical protein IT304_04160 [Dehalococcoidia bacterium]|nr:hypothetical protein [Dehalococcoidia bacterium]
MRRVTSAKPLPARRAVVGLALLALVVFAAPEGVPASAQAPSPAATDAFPGPLVTAPDDLTLSNMGATTEAGEPLPPNAGATVWLSFVATHRAAAGTVVSADFPVFVAAYEGDQLASLHEVAFGNRSAVGLFALVFTTTPGNTYHLQIGSEGLAAARGTVTLRLLPEGDPPPNDAFPGTRITALPFEDRASTTFATLAPGEPALFGATVWYAYTATAAARLLADTVGSDFATRVAVYDEATRTLPGGRPVVSHGRCDGVDSVVLDVGAGETVWFQVGGEGFPGERGLLRFTVKPRPAAQAVNPRCALAPVGDLAATATFGAETPDRPFRAPGEREAQVVVTWGYEAAFTGSFHLRRQLWNAFSDVVPPAVDVALLPASADGRHRFSETVRLAPGSRACYDVRAVQGELSGPVARACTERAPAAPVAPGPPDAGSGRAIRGAGGERALAAGAVLLAASLLIASSARVARGRPR